MKNKFSLLVAAFFIYYGTNNNIAIDIQLHDTYLVIALIHVLFFLVIGVVLVDLIYFILERKEFWLIKGFKVAHTVSGILTLLLASFLYKEYTMYNSLGTYWIGGSRSIGDDRMFWLDTLSLALVGLFVFTIVTICLNFVIALVKGKKPYRPMKDDTILDS